MADEQPKFGADGATYETQHAVEADDRMNWPARFKPLGEQPGDWLTDPPDPIDALLLDGDDPSRCYLPCGRVGLLAAAGGVGKTHALVQLALCIATKRPWLGHFRPGTVGAVALLVGEETADEIHRRLYWTAHLLGLNAAEQQLARERIWPVSLCGVQAALVDANGTPTEFMGQLLASLETQGPADGFVALLLDPASRFMGPEAETDNAAATAFVVCLEQLAATHGHPAVLVSHHTRKSDRDGGSVDAVAARGSSALVDGVRWVATMGIPNDTDDAGKKEPSINLVVLANPKNNYAQRAKDCYLERHVHGVLKRTDRRPLEQPKGNKAKHKGSSGLDDGDVF